MRGMSVLTWLLCAAMTCGAAEETCPWLNAATAAGILGGAVEAEVGHAAKDGGVESCEFTRRGESGVATLRIDVGTADLKCAAGGAAVRGLGNEARACPIEKTGGEMSARVIGRVREQWFAIRVGTTDRRSLLEALPDEALRAAAQVAGNLF